ncbi:hemophore-related protein [Mycolicibacterium peregrinum]|uniref:heme-binding protein n=1 Tax=Mycolicibacterium TaxID=1866885 RepID=UPI000B4ABD5E|nr:MULTISPECIES: heme-binding protein [Mycolicibacterium]MCV7003211.1 heme-binding protein [Mycolicibacterium alvei]OWL96012.1 hemophore-related protein [Mycolicibacterium peregrinum]
MPTTLPRLAAAGAVALGAAALLGGPVAAADPTTDPPRPPNCSAADLAGVASGVAAATSAYLFTHPGVNEFFTGLHGRPHDEVPAAIKAFFDAHPQQHAELSGIRQPLVDFRARCGITAPDRLEGQ